MPSCSKELNQWEPLTEYGQSKGHSNPYLVLECAWRVSNWAAMKEALVQVSSQCVRISTHALLQAPTCTHLLTVGSNIETIAPRHRHSGASLELNSVTQRLDCTFFILFLVFSSALYVNLGLQATLKCSNSILLPPCSPQPLTLGKNERLGRKTVQMQLSSLAH